MDNARGPCLARLNNTTWVSPTQNWTTKDDPFYLLAQWYWSFSWTNYSYTFQCSDGTVSGCKLCRYAEVSYQNPAGTWITAPGGILTPGDVGVPTVT